jgi:ABC-type molybdenum transport system ATPase subunit/photorepair protein PhrA
MTTNSDQPQDGDNDPGTAPASATAPMPPSRRGLTRLKINRFRHVKPGTELRFDDGINVLLGRNGTGKTTLLDLIAAVASGDLRAYKAEIFDLEFEVELGDLSFLVQAQNTFGLGQSVLHQETGELQSHWSYQVSLSDAEGKVGSAESSRRGARIRQESAPDTALSVEEVSLFQPCFYVLQWSTARHEQLHPSVFSGAFNGFFWQRNIASCCLRLDEGLDVFRCMIEGGPLPRIMAPLMLFTSSDVSLTNDGGLNKTNVAPYLTNETRSTYIPQSLFSKMAEREAAHGDLVVSFRADELDFMATTIDALGVKEMQCTMKLLRREQVDGSETHLSIFGQPSFWVTTHRGTTFTHDQLSYGEKRLLAFMYHAAANPQILVADELVNGLHHEWIQACLDAIKGQAFLTSQNPLLLDHLPFSSAEEVQRRFVLCSRDEHGNWIWKNVDQDAADAFYRAYQVGIQHVSEILETKGLW